MNSSDLVLDILDIIQRELDDKVVILRLADKFPQEITNDTQRRDALSYVLTFAIVRYLHQKGIFEVDLLEDDFDAEC